MEKMKFKYITPFIDEDFFLLVKKGMNDAAKLFDVEVEFTGTEDADCTTLAALIDQAVAEKCAGLAVSILDPKQLNNAVAKAAEAGVVSIAFNIRGDDETQVLSSVCQDVYNAGVKVGKLAKKHITADSKILITLHDDIDVLRQRANGIMSVLSDVETQVIVTGNTPELAASVIREYLKNDKTINAIIATGQSDTHGAGIVAKEMDKKIYIAGFDVCAEILALVKEGIIDL